MSIDDIDIQHVDGVAWYDAPLPPRLHRCQTQTSGWLRILTKVERCACGAMRVDGNGWANKNERRRP